MSELDSTPPQQPEITPAQQPQTMAGCILMLLILLVSMTGAYGIVRLIYWLIGEPMPIGLG